MTETFYATQQVQVLTRQRLATRRNRVLRGPGATPAAKRTQGACRLRDRASKVILSGADAVNLAEGSMAYSELAWGKWSAGVEERGMQARVAQEPGRSRFLHPQQAARAPR